MSCIFCSACHKLGNESIGVGGGPTSAGFLLSLALFSFLLCFSSCSGTSSIASSAAASILTATTASPFIRLPACAGCTPPASAFLSCLWSSMGCPSRPSHPSGRSYWYHGVGIVVLLLSRAAIIVG